MIWVILLRDFRKWLEVKFFRKNKAQAMVLGVITYVINVENLVIILKSVLS